MEFSMERGVKQGDVIRPLLSMLVWNMLGIAWRKWKVGPPHCGWDVGADELLTNARYPDDLGLVLQIGTGELSLVWLDLNNPKPQKFNDPKLAMLKFPGCDR